MNEPKALVAFLDANVLYPALLRNLLMYFGAAGLYQPRWSARVHGEWMSALGRLRPDIPQAQIERTRLLMDTEIADAMVEGYDHRVAGLVLPDAEDRHILAAAIQCEAQIIVTANLRDFPATALAPHAIVAEHPDVFLSRLLTDQKTEALRVFRLLCAGYRNPPRTAQEITASMKRQGLGVAADILYIMLGL